MLWAGAACLACAAPDDTASTGETAPADVTRAEAAAPDYPRTYQYTYEYNTATLNENHYIVLDSGSTGIEGWYYGTTDDFDSVREGYEPGFFVAPMESLRLQQESIAFTLRPRALFTTPVPLRYRAAAQIPAGSLTRWSTVGIDSARAYSGTLNGDTIRLAVERGDRRFTRIRRE